MIATVWQREIREYGRNRPFLVLFVVAVVLIAAASLNGWNRSRAQAQAREDAAKLDRKVWVEQGDNNPHGAAHFSRYAFRPTPPLAAFDPGVLDYGGSAVWLEAHHQNPATLRRAEDSSARAPLAAMSAAWVCRVIGSLALLLLLFQAIVQEREAKTLRSVVAAGLGGSTFVAGKVSAALSAALLVVGVALLLSLAPATWVMPGELDIGHLIVVFISYLLGLSACALAFIAVSARSSSSGGSLAMGASIWLIWSVLVPILSAQVALSMYPDMQEQEFKAIIQKESQTDFWEGKARDVAIESYTQKLMEERGVDSADKLDLNKDGIRLQASEEYANGVFDRRYGELYERHRAQDRILSVASLASPILALERISAGLSGTDLAAQQRFSSQAESHRRKIIHQLNADMMHNAGDKGFKYKAGRKLWESIADFEGQEPSLSETLQNYWLEIVSLLIWLCMGAVAAVLWTRGVIEEEI